MISVLVDERISKDCERSLLIKGFYPIKLPPHRGLPKAIASHPDSLVFYSNNRLFVPAEYCEDATYIFTDIRDRHPHIKLCFTSDELGNEYPKDCKMNFLQIGSKAFGKISSLSSALIDFAKEEGIEIINTQQGYPACSALAFKNSVITADAGLKKTFLSSGISVTEIESGDISLPPYEYGFIGGVSGVFGDKVYFFGDYKSHKNAEMIESALKKEGYTPISLSGEPLTDLGGMVFLT